MTQYQVQIDAENFLVDMDGSVSKHGFFTTRIVEADDPSSAELAAVQSLRDDPDLRAVVKNDELDPPVMNVTGIEAVSSPRPEETDTGKVWYEMSPKRWWQFWRRS